MWSSGPASHGQSSGKGWREQEITRQPAEEKRLTVAWPMPREAPVRMSVLRSSLGISTMIVASRIEAGLGPRIARRGAAEHDAVMQPEGAGPPELDLGRNQPVAAPIGRARDVARAERLGQALDLGFENGAARERPRLLRGASADAAGRMARGEIGIGLGVGRGLDRSPDANLAPETLPIEQQRGLRRRGELLALGALAIRIEDEAVIYRLPSGESCGHWAVHPDRRWPRPWPRDRSARPPRPPPSSSGTGQMGRSPQ